MSDGEPQVDPSESSHIDPRIPLAYQRTDLASERSRWAAERTMMAWIRTAISMISFGFAIDKVFATLQFQEKAMELGSGYHLLGLALVVAGILFLLLGSVEHLIILKRLENRFGISSAPLNPRFPLPLFGACVVLVIGVAAIVLML